MSSSPTNGPRSTVVIAGLVTIALAAVGWLFAQVHTASVNLEAIQATIESQRTQLTDGFKANEKLMEQGFGDLGGRIDRLEKNEDRRKSPNVKEPP